MNSIETGRLVLRLFERKDTSAFFSFYKDQETMQFMHVLTHEDVSDTMNLFDNDLKWGAEIWTVLKKNTRDIIGHIHFIGGSRVPGMGYLFNRDEWGQGYATEAMTAMITYAFNRKKLDRVELWINENNFASRRVAEKLGFKVKGRIHQRYDWEENHHIMLTYGLWADEWVQTGQTAARNRPSFFNVQPVLLVPDVTETIRFYTERLGFEIDFTVGDPPEHAGLGRGDWSSDAAYIQITAAAKGEKIRPQGWLCFMVEAQIDDLFADYLVNEVEIIRAPQTYPWGMREFSIRDLNGYELRFGTRDSGQG